MNGKDKRFTYPNTRLKERERENKKALKMPSKFKLAFFFLNKFFYLIREFQFMASASNDNSSSSD